MDGWVYETTHQLLCSFTWLIFDLIVEFLEFTEPTDSLQLEDLWFLEVLEVCVIHSDFEFLFCSNQVGPPFLKGMDNHKEFFIIVVL